MAAAARNWGDYVRGELNSINAASRLTDLKTLREIVDTLRVVVNRCCAAEENAEGLEEPAEGAAGVRGNLAAEQGAEPHEWVRNGNGTDVWYRNTVTDETAWEVPPGGILRAEENERPPPPPAPSRAGDAARLEGVPAFATAANRAAARGAVPPPSLPLGTRAGRLAANMEGCDGVTPEDCRAARLKLRRANSQLAAASVASADNAGNAARENNSNIVTPPGSPPSSLAASPVTGQSGGNRRKRKTKKNRRNYKSRRTIRRYT